MRSNALGILVLVCAGLSFLGCGDDAMSGTGGMGGSNGPCDTGEVECDTVCIPAVVPVLAVENGIQESVFNVSCNSSSCHDSQNPEEGLDMSSAEASEMNLINVQSTQVMSKDLVSPNDLDNSYLYDKILGQNLAPGTQRMPFGVLPLCDAKIDAVEAWILDGAP